MTMIWSSICNLVLVKILTTNQWEVERMASLPARQGWYGGHLVSILDGVSGR